jgi:hypothetical protein
LEISLETVATHFRSLQSDKAKAVKGIEKMKDQYNAEIAKMGQAYSKLEQYIQRIDVLKGQYVESLGRERLQKATALKLQN